MDVIKYIKTSNKSIADPISDNPHCSLIECILSCGFPTSIVRIPSLADNIGPIVDPHGESFLTTNSCKGVFLYFAHSRSTSVE